MIYILDEKSVYGGGQIVIEFLLNGISTREDIVLLLNREHRYSIIGPRISIVPVFDYLIKKSNSIFKNIYGILTGSFRVFYVVHSNKKLNKIVIVNGYMTGVRTIPALILLKYSGYRILYIEHNSTISKNIYSSLLLNSCTEYIAVSHEIKDQYWAIYKKRFCFVNNPGVQIKKRKRHSETFTLGWVGRFSEEKDPLLAINIFKMLEKHIPSIQLLFFGEGPLRNTMEKEVNDNIHIFGYTNREEIYNSIDTILITSKNEGHPLILSECIVNEIPVISTRVGDYRYLDGKISNLYYIEHIITNEEILKIVKYILVQQNQKVKVSLKFDRERERYRMSTFYEKYNQILFNSY